jgi:hypothetical protein
MKSSCRGSLARTSITGLIHALVLAPLSRRVPNAPGFVATTPISMRPYLLPMTDEALKHTLRNLISVIDHRISAQEISEFCDGGG